MSDSKDDDFPLGATVIWRKGDPLPPGTKTDPVVRAFAVYEKTLSAEEIAAWTAGKKPPPEDET